MLGREGERSVDVIKDGINFTCFGRRVKEQRILCNMTQEKLGHEIGSDGSYISKVESGKIVSLAMALKLSVALHCSLDQLLYDSYCACISRRNPDRNSELVTLLAEFDSQTREIAIDALKSIHMAANAIMDMKLKKEQVE